jgi:hypothetical protein
MHGIKRLAQPGARAAVALAFVRVIVERGCVARRAKNVLVVVIQRLRQLAVKLLTFVRAINSEAGRAG